MRGNMKRKEYQELTIEERVAKEKKKTKIVFIAVIMGILAIIGFFWLLGDAILDIMIPETPVYELSEEEKKWIKPVFIDQERIEEGRLLNYQIWEVEKGRYGLSVLNEKYPGYQFRITYLYIDSSFSNFTVKEKRTGECFSMYVSRNEDGSYEVEDNFYAYLFKGKYENYLLKQLKIKIDNIIEVNSGITSVKGREYDINMTVEDILTERLQINPRIYIHISAKGMSIEDCMNYANLVENEVKNIDLYGSYDVFFWNSTEEMKNNNDSDDCLYKYSFQIFERREDIN